MEQLTRQCTIMFRACCKEIPGAQLPRNYEYKFKHSGIKLCRYCNDGDNHGNLVQSLVITLSFNGTGMGLDSAPTQHLPYNQRYYYSVQAQLPFCPWKSARCCKAAARKAMAPPDPSAADHNQNRVLMEIHPKGEHGDAFVKLFCFSAKCVADMPSDKRLRVAIARYPAKYGDRPSMNFSEAVFEFSKLAGRAAGLQ